MREFLQQLAALNVKFDQLVSRTPPGASSNRQKKGGGSEASTSTSFGTIQSRTLKLHLPHFEGGGPSRWVYRAEQFFYLSSNDTRPKAHHCFFSFGRRSTSMLLMAGEISINRSLVKIVCRCQSYSIRSNRV